MTRLWRASLAAATVLASNAAAAQEYGILEDAVSGDRACYLTFADGSGATFETMAVFALCESPGLIGQALRLRYEDMQVMAMSCEGDPNCTDVEIVPLVVEATPAK